MTNLVVYQVSFVGVDRPKLFVFPEDMQIKDVYCHIIETSTDKVVSIVSVADAILPCGTIVDFD